MQVINEWWQEVAAWISLDWSDQLHYGCLAVEGCEQIEHFKVEQRSEALQEWVAKLRLRFGGKRVVVALEQSRGALMYSLMECEFFVLVPINPKSLACFRKTFQCSGAKDDPTDADLLLELVRRHYRKLHAWVPDDEQTRALRLLSERRRDLVDERTALINRLQSCLKECFPQALVWLKDLSDARAHDFLARWPSLQALQRAPQAQLRKFFLRYRHKDKEQWVQTLLAEIGQAVALTNDFAVLTAHRLTVQALVSQLGPLNASIQKFDEKIVEIFAQHPDHEIFTSLPGAGEVLAPRLLACFGSQRSRFANAQEFQQFSGTAPVQKRSGKSIQIQRRYASSKFIKQSCHEFAQCSLPHSEWAGAFYQWQKSRGKNHHAAVRALAFKWNRILFACWLTRSVYDEQVYLERLRRRGSPLLQWMAKQPAETN
jgi:transposase